MAVVGLGEESCWFGDHAAVRLSDDHHTTLWFWHPLPYVSHNLKLLILAELFRLLFFLKETTVQITEELISGLDMFRFLNNHLHLMSQLQSEGRAA